MSYLVSQGEFKLSDRYCKIFDISAREDRTVTMYYSLKNAEGQNWGKNKSFYFQVFSYIISIFS